MAGVGAPAAVLSVGEMLNGNREQWEKFLNDNREYINNVKDQQGRPLLISAICRLYYKFFLMTDNSEFEIFCRQEIEVIEFFSEHCDLSVKSVEGYCPAEFITHSNPFGKLKDNPTFMKLLLKLLTPQLINDFPNRLFSQLG